MSGGSLMWVEGRSTELRSVTGRVGSWATEVKSLLAPFNLKCKETLLKTTVSEHNTI